LTNDEQAAKGNALKYDDSYIYYIYSIDTRQTPHKYLHVIKNYTHAPIQIFPQISNTNLINHFNPRC